jgi:hypothetical protein
MKPHYVLKISSSIIIKDSFFTICPYPDSYFSKKVWVMPKHIWIPELYMFGVCNELKAKFHHSRDFITHILSGNWADMRKEMQD